MSEEKVSDEEEVKPPAIGGTFLTMMFMLWIIINPELRDFMGETAGTVLEPRITFDYQYPVLTFLFAGIIMISFTTIIRHFIIDWEKMAEIQTKMGAYNKEMGEARQSGNEAKMKKLFAMQPQIMMLQSEMMSNQMKPMAFTMIIAIPIIMWLRIFVNGLDLQVMSLPWEPNYSLDEDLWILPHWILVYSGLSLPFGQIIMRVLKIGSNSGGNQTVL
ncbi:MAG: DUF106 domain-containing protein [Candidatus Poseidoniales archaeon]|uniref:DUF106 domain-containing protein n=1 Tax=Marine Group III euryarchaeote CG-Epi6 TaxID=1889000 RepID=A0A1J5SSY7_9ARCH|nr:MAG: hypothetical protein BEU03_02715 [Marine Group III euryarchaeote CG-Epi6]